MAERDVTSAPHFRLLLAVANCRAPTVVENGTSAGRLHVQGRQQGERDDPIPIRVIFPLLPYTLGRQAPRSSGRHALSFQGERPSVSNSLRWCGRRLGEQRPGKRCSRATESDATDALAELWGLFVDGKPICGEAMCTLAGTADVAWQRKVSIAGNGVCFAL
jgi:hypothetical protein